MRKPYDKDWKYTFGRMYVDSSVRSVFSDIKSIGKENIPSDGAVLFAPNHCNTLMDALVILQDWKEGTLFGARADIFRKPLIKKILRFLKILPIPRVRDGAQEVLRNRETMDEVVECLSRGMKYCMFCEGTHRPKHSLLPLKKGIARTALLANERLGEKTPVYIVPTGLEYQDYYRILTPVAIRYGEPINVTEYLKAHPEDGAGRASRSLLGILRERISRLITCLPDDETYEGRWGLTKIIGLEAALEAGPELIAEAEAFEKERRAARLSSWSFGRKRPLASVMVRTLAGLVVLPFALLAAVLSAPMWILAEHIVRGLKDKAFTKTARFGVKFAMTPLMLIIWALVFFLCLPFWQAVAWLVFALLSYNIFYWALERGRILLSDIRLLFGYKDLKKAYSRLAEKSRGVIQNNQTKEI